MCSKQNVLLYSVGKTSQISKYVSSYDYFTVIFSKMTYLGVFLLAETNAMSVNQNLIQYSHQQGLPGQQRKQEGKR